MKDEAAEGYLLYLKNHDQAANHLHGDRLHTLAGPAGLRALNEFLDDGAMICSDTGTVITRTARHIFAKALAKGQKVPWDVEKTVVENKILEVV